MQKIIIILLLILSVSCTYEYAVIDPFDFYPSIITITEIESIEAKDIETKIMTWIAFKISYKKDINNYNKHEYFATCQETLDKMSGDCEDMSILFLGLLNKLTEHEGKLLFQCDNYNNVVHCSARYKDFYFNYKQNYKIKKEIVFNDIKYFMERKNDIF